MSKMPKLKLTLIVIVALVVVFLVVVAMQSPTYLVSRSLTISAPPESVFAQINDLRQWEAWNPWGKLDPNMALTYGGAESGVGAYYAWAGNSDVGEGRATIIESRAPEVIRLKMEFFKPMKDVSEAQFTLTPQDQATQVTWAMSGHKNFIGKALCMFMDMDTMVGGKFEEGLAAMKSICEAPASELPSTSDQ